MIFFTDRSQVFFHVTIPIDSNVQLWWDVNLEERCVRRSPDDGRARKKTRSWPAPQSLSYWKLGTVRKGKRQGPLFPVTTDHDRSRNVPLALFLSGRQTIDFLSLFFEKKNNDHNNNKTIFYKNVWGDGGENTSRASGRRDSARAREKELADFRDVFSETGGEWITVADNARALPANITRYCRLGQRNDYLFLRSLLLRLRLLYPFHPNSCPVCAALTTCPGCSSRLEAIIPRGWIGG